MYSNQDVESQHSSKYLDQFEDRDVRHDFIRKVYSIVFIQLSITVATICLFIYVDELRLFAWDHPWLLWVFLGCTIAFWLSLLCIDSRSSPCNVISVVCLTILESLICAFISTYYRTEIVLMAAGLTALIVLALTLFAMQTKIDFTTCSAFLFVGFILLLVLGIAAIFIRNRILHLVISAFGVLLFSILLIYNTQMIMGNHKESLSPDEYVFAALSLYSNIIQLFLSLLGLMGDLVD